MRFHLSKLAMCCATALAISAGTSAMAETHVAVPASAADQIAELPTGDQLVLEEFSGTLPFAGQELQLESFTGLLGYSAEVAYVVNAGGTVRADGKLARTGRMLLIAPFGRGIVSERFDAARLHDSLSSSPNASTMQGILPRLEDLARGQQRGVFLGRLGRTNFNVATLGSGEAEVDRRSRIGGTAVREARFAAPTAGVATEQAIVERFMSALARKDPAAVSQFLDPLPYGYSNLEQGGDAARTAMAASLIARHDWNHFAARQISQSGETSWTVQGTGLRAVIELRRTADFAFVQSIKVEE
ncbi:hypothetical protein [Altererythrobacter sp. ZODW24]|uniref:hypothetical protein n=1 Tax=Altererythrobacter sp. ZODW24 TaxID=2185142 RepID=UPI0013B37FA9|nr:hypothetical protein [Altererythrobacter sp. ZODW24]